MKLSFVRLALMSSLLAILHVFPANAQELEFESYTVESETGTWMGFALDDINGDGNLDVAVQNGGNGGPLLWYEASEGGTQWTSHVVAKEGPGGKHFASSDLEVADFDGDGDIDIPGMEHPGPWPEFQGRNGSFAQTSIYWYENSGDGENWTPHELGTMPDFVKDIELEDYDGDGDVDASMITYGDEHAFGVFRQEEDGSFTRVQLSSLPEVHEGMDSGDFDGDGDLDIAANGYWIENPGGDLTDVWTVRPIDPMWFTQTTDDKSWSEGGGWRHNATKTTAADLNEDGTDEVLIAQSEASGYPIMWYEPENPERPGGWTPHLIGEGLNAVHTLEVADFDGDGTPDVLAGENGQSDAGERDIHDDGIKQVVIYLNQGESESWTPVVFSHDGLYQGRIGDFNGDGQPDIAGPTGHEGVPYRVHLGQ